MNSRHSSRARRAFTLIELMVVVATLAFLGMMVLQRLARNKALAQRATCTGHLKQIGLAFRVWSGDHNDQYPMLALTNKDGTREIASASNMFRWFQVMSNELNNPLVLVCPTD